MTAIESGRKQRLWALEAQIRSNYEAFVQTGFALKEIRDDELYKEDGFSTWDAYLKDRVGEEFGIEQAQAWNLIRCAQVRTKLPNLQHAVDSREAWSQRELLEFSRLAPRAEGQPGQPYDFDRLKKKDVERVARKVIEHCERQGTPPTAPIVRQFVDAELGIDRAASAKASKQKRREAEDAVERQKAEGSRLDRHINDLIWQLKQYTESLNDVIAEVGDEEWKQWGRDNQVLIKRLIAACSAFIDLLRGKGYEHHPGRLEARETHA